MTRSPGDTLTECFRMSDTDVHKVVIDIIPVPKPRMTQSDKWNERTATGRYWAFKDELILKCRLKRFVMPESFVIIFCMPVPKGWSDTKRQKMIGEPHQEKPDIDNLLKGFMDALADEDKRIHKIQVSKVWTENPGIMVVWPL